MTQAAGIDRNLDLTPAQLWRLSEYRRRLEYVRENYNFWKDALNDLPTFNESLELLRRAFEVPKRKRTESVRLHSLIEIGITFLANRRPPVGFMDVESSPAEMESAARELLKRLQPIRGRPENSNLRYHVWGLILACEWATGVPVTASSTTKSDYDPQVTSAGAKAIWMAFRRIDPSVTKTSIVNIIRASRASGELIGKRFEDLFPLYEPQAHPDFGPPGAPQIEVHFAYPIYCS